MDVHLITDAGVSQCAPEDLPELLERREGLVWVDIPRVDQEATRVLAELMLVDARTDLELWHIQGSLLANVDRLLREIDLERGPDARRVRRR